MLTVLLGLFQVIAPLTGQASWQTYEVTLEQCSGCNTPQIVIGNIVIRNENNKSL